MLIRVLANLAHNCVAHPLLAFTGDHPAAVKLHDATARLAYPGRPIPPRPGAPLPVDLGYGILSGTAIHAAVRDGTIELDPFDPAHLNPASYDVTLDHRVLVYEAVTRFDHGEFTTRTPTGINLLPDPTGVLDAAIDNPTRRFELKPWEPMLLRPGIGYLMATAERIATDRYTPVIDGKSSLGRLFVKIHETAGYADPGWRGALTLEVTVQQPTIVYAGMRIGQVRFHTLVGQPELYAAKGHYAGDVEGGPVASKTWRQIAEQRARSST